MIIDMHVSAAFIEGEDLNEKQLQYCQKQTGLYKTEELEVEYLKTLTRVSKVDKLCLLPLDLKTIHKGNLGSNEKVAKLVENNPDFFIGFASVDPHREDAVEILEEAFEKLKLSGLKLHPSHQKFYPNDEYMDKIYEVCLKYNKPIIFHSGMSPRPQVLTKYSHPLQFEEVAAKYPNLRICLSHFGWPWVKEVCMLMLKYKNVYTDTSFLYFDNPKEIYHQFFEVEIGPHWIDRSLRHQVMFASDEPRLEQHRMIAAIRNMDWRESTKKMILGENAIAFLQGGTTYD